MTRFLTVLKMIAMLVWAVIAGTAIALFFIVMIIFGQYKGEGKDL
jgi:hypothetical protein